MTAAITPKAGVIGGRNAREARGTRGNGPSATSDFATHRREIGTFVVTIPFFAYTACFLLAPTVIVIVGAFQNVDADLPSTTSANSSKRTPSPRSPPPFSFP